MLPCIDERISVLNLKNNKYGREWTSNFAYVDELVRLGTASELIYFPFEKDEWKHLPGGKPIVASLDYDKDSMIEGYPKESYEEVVKEYKKSLLEK